MKIDLHMRIEVDPSANFLECNDENDLHVIMELIQMQFYDLDDLVVKEIDLEKV